MPEIEKKESGQPNVEQPERGDPRQHQQPIDKVRDTGRTRDAADDGPPAGRGNNSPWLGGG